MIRTHGLYATAWLRWQDYLMLTKPKVVALLLLTALVGMYLTGQVPSLSRLGFRLRRLLPRGRL